MLKKINSLLTQSSIAAANSAAAKKQRPEITVTDVKLPSDDAADNGRTTWPPGLARSANTVKIYVSYDSGRYSITDYMLYCSFDSARKAY